ncbi:hypothetical protein H5410_031757 [Solanum commersonii]|uniref:Uncharacterized protein n=1 Tax=Solanum commersonii TaxID=4109 RepID=A0A9J5YI25_SOLCO|nr:hypothetical protein H5410_031757 [Solanum commersonii]
MKSKIYNVNEVPNLLIWQRFWGAARYKATEVWSGVMEKVEKKHLSMDGRLALINGVLDSIPTYIMSLVPMPCKVLLPKEQRGLTVRDLSKHNNSLLLKWWFLEMENQTFGKKWTVSFKVGNGSAAKFWKDKWVINQALKDSHPRLFLKATEPDSSIAENKEGSILDIQFRRNLQELLADFSMNLQLPDNLRWGDSSKGTYTVKAGYSHINADDVMTDLRPWKLLTFGLCFYQFFQSAEQPLSNLNEAVERWSLWKVDKSITKIWQMIPACIFFNIFMDREE